MNYKYKRVGLVAMICSVAIIVALALIKCVPTEVSADPLGPPTIKMYLQNIHSGTVFIKWMIGAMGGMFTALIGAVVYAYKRDIAEVRKNASDAFKEINSVKREFLSKEGHDRGCPHRSPAVEAGH